MVYTAAFRQLAPVQRAQLLYQQAQADMSRKLWNAALGSAQSGDPDPGHGTARVSGETDLSFLLTLLTRSNLSAPAPQLSPAPDRDGSGFSPPSSWEGGREHSDGQDAPASPAWSAGLGPNAGQRGALTAAAARTGIPAEALAAIVNAEAAKGPDGSWLSYSRNPRSSAAGLGQFLSGTWKGEAERPGSWLNAYAQAQGWMNERGHIRSEAKSDLLALRYDARASIETIADYARDNLAKMRDAGIDPGSDVNGVARAAYFAHHLGLGDAIRFLKRGLDSHRAEYLLTAQIGSAAASQRIAACGDAAQAHRAWLMDYMARQFRPGRFSAAFSA